MPKLFRALLFLTLLPLARAEEPGSTTASNGRYYTWPEIRRTIDAWKKDYPKLVHEEALGKTAEGREIPIVRISDEAAEASTAKPEILIMGGIHPREQQPQIAVMRLAGELLRGCESDARIQQLLRTRRVWLLPVLNVDGKIYDMEKNDGSSRGANWRKNRSRGTGGTLGVDLNRNFPIRWGGGSAKPGAATYQGSAPLSEPEAQALVAFLEAHPIRLFVDLHSHMRAIFHPMYLVAGEHERYREMLTGLFAAQKSHYRSYTNLPAAGASPADTRGGDTGLSFQFAYYALGIYSFNIEIAGASFYDPPGRIEQEYRDNVRKALLYLIDKCGDLPARREGTATARWPEPAVPLTPGATLHWKPEISGPCAYAVLISLSPEVTITSEYRPCPLQEGFTLKVSPRAKPGAPVSLRLYLWAADHARSVVDFSVTIPKR